MVIETPRLSLSPHCLADFDCLHAMWADTKITQYISGRPSTEEESWDRLTRYAGHWALLDFGYWAVKERASGLYIGDIGFGSCHRQLEPPVAGIPELGWAIATKFHGHGFATEGTQAALKWADRHLMVGRVVSIIDPANLTSIRVAKKCGFSEIARTSYKGKPTILYERATAASLAR